MRVCDLIADYVYRCGIDDVFMISGGGLMYLTDGLACNEKLNKVCCHHEQAVAMAAVAYAKYRGMGCAYVTTGCGGTNAITGLLNAWQDNVPCIFISGQCKRRETLGYVNLPIRQIGVQEADIISIVKSITKYAVMVERKEDILYHLEKAFFLAKNGRPGPVWLDIPMDIQSAEVEEESLKHFDSDELKPFKKEITPKEVEGLICDLKNASRPVLVAGHGVRLAGATEELYEFAHIHKIPVVFSRLGTDVMPTMDDLNIGRIGNKGTRAANFALQNADLVIAVGSRLSVSSTGQEYGYFAREAKVVAIDIDKYEHLKQTVHVEQIIQADAKDVLQKLLLSNWNQEYCDWAKKCLEWKKAYPVCLEEYYEDDSQGINMYLFVEELSKCFKDDSVVVTDAGSAVYVPAQGIKTYDKKQRYITSGAQAEMGFTLPAAIGTCVARNGKEVLGITGDGSFQMNIQELQTLIYHKFPVKLFVWNNDGYLSIRATQNKFFDGRFIGTDSTSGVSFPEVEKIANAYGITYFRIDSIKDLEEKLPAVLAENEPVLCEVKIIRDQEVIPSVSSRQLKNGKLVSSPIEDMYPFMPRDEFEQNMIVKPVEEN